MMRILYCTRYSIWASRQDWKVRQRVIKNLERIGFDVEQCPNPCRLNATKGERLFIIDIIDGEVLLDPIKFVGRDEIGNQPVVVASLPDDGQYGVPDDDSVEFRDAIEVLGDDIKPFVR